MPKASEGGERKSRYDRFSKPQIRNDSHERFSSFETLPLSENEDEEFSDFESSQVDLDQPKNHRSSGRKKRSHIRIEDRPLQYDETSSKPKRSPINNDPKLGGRPISSQESHHRETTSGVS
jgi:hypothetical protein